MHSYSYSLGIAIAIPKLTRCIFVTMQVLEKTMHINVHDLILKIDKLSHLALQEIPII